VKKLAYISSNTYSIICPCCGIDELERSAEGEACCSRCDHPISTQVLKTLEQIVSCQTLSGATPVSVVTQRCGIWLRVFCGVLAADRRFFPFRLLRCSQNRG
jgi:hypothetical protein